MSHRPEQLAALIRRSIQALLVRGLNDPRIRGLVSVTKVVLDRESDEARVLISVLPEKHATLSLAGLRSAAPLLQRRLHGSLGLRRMPRLVFDLDDSLKKAAQLDAAVSAGLPQPAPPPQGPSTTWPQPSLPPESRNP